MARIDDAFTQLLDELRADPRVRPGMVFGRRAAKLGAKVFACDVDGDLVVKLGQARVEELVAAGTAAPFAPMGPDRPMRGWARIPPADAGDAVTAWMPYAEEARSVVEAGAADPPRRGTRRVEP